MNFEEEFPLRYYLNLGRREDRRVEMEWLLEQTGVTVERFPAVDARFVRNPRGYDEKGRYALALTIRLAIRRAKQKRAKALLLFEDDGVLHPNFLELVEGIELPEDWGIFYFGCQHRQRPEPYSDGVVRVKKALDSHDWAIHESAYDEVMRAMDAARHPLPHHPLASDQFVVALQERILGVVLAMAGYPVDDFVYNQDATWTHWPKEGAGSPASHDRLARERLVSILRSGAIFARKFPPGADVGKYGLHLE